MKQLMILITALFLSASVFAQEKMDKKMKMDKKDQKMDMKKDHLMMMDGKMKMVKNGKEMVMDKDMTLSNGTTVTKEGTMKTKTGETMAMKEGDVIYMDGKMSKMKM
ncbi:MAG: hypothetical protein DI539_15695 [Flavobacterium psychrophilum]|nr:MAG: hypothetical protein DI539_15695 [Flavobacterium psychrophilum]